MRVRVAKHLLAAVAAQHLLASGKTSGTAESALGWDLQAVGIWPGPAEEIRRSQDHSDGAGENCAIKNQQKEKLVDVQTGSWPWHLN